MERAEEEDELRPKWLCHWYWSLWAAERFEVAKEGEDVGEEEEEEGFAALARRPA